MGEVGRVCFWFHFCAVFHDCCWIAFQMVHTVQGILVQVYFCIPDYLGLSRDLSRLECCVISFSYVTSENGERVRLKHSEVSLVRLTASEKRKNVI
jgi:hypothetical protein